MTVTIPIRAIELTPGSTITIHNLSWQDFETVLSSLAEARVLPSGLKLTLKTKPL